MIIDTPNTPINYAAIDPEVTKLLNQVLAEVKQLREDLNKPKYPWGGPG